MGQVMPPMPQQQPQPQPQQAQPGGISQERAQQMGAELGNVGFPPELIQRLVENPIAQQDPESIFQMLMTLFAEQPQQQMQPQPQQPAPQPQAMMPQGGA